MIKYVVANVIVRGESLPLTKLNFVTRVTPVRRTVVFGGETLSSALRMTREEALALVVDRSDMMIHAVRE